MVVENTKPATVEKFCKVKRHRYAHLSSYIDLKSFEICECIVFVCIQLNAYPGNGRSGQPFKHCFHMP